MQQRLDTLGAVLSATDPEYPFKVSTERIVNNDKLLHNSVKLAETNGLYYIFVQNLRKNGFNLSGVHEARMRAEMANYSEYIELLQIIDKLENEHSIEYVVIKASNKIPHIPRDIDIFVRAHDRDSVIEILKDNHLNLVHESVAETSLIYRHIKVDIYTEICYMGKEFIDGDYLLASKRRDYQFDIEYNNLSDDVNLLLLLVHGLFGHRSMTLLDFLHIKLLLQSADVSECKDYAESKGWKATFEALLKVMIDIETRLYSDLDFRVSFPYIFNKPLVMRCVSDIGYHDMSFRQRFFIHLTLMQDRLLLALVGTDLHHFVKSRQELRRFVNSASTIVKIGRGDTKSYK
jgi:hypothetical protein